MAWDQEHKCIRRNLTLAQAFGDHPWECITSTFADGRDGETLLHDIMIRMLHVEKHGDKHAFQTQRELYEFLTYRDRAYEKISIEQEKQRERWFSTFLCFGVLCAPYEPHMCSCGEVLF
jgi:hypothetical protein